MLGASPGLSAAPRGFHLEFPHRSPELTLELYHANDREDAAGAPRPFQAVVALHDALKQTPLFRTGLWLVLADWSARSPGRRAHDAVGRIRRRRNRVGDRLCDDVLSLRGRGGFPLRLLVVLGEPGGRSRRLPPPQPCVRRFARHELAGSRSSRSKAAPAAATMRSINASPNSAVAAPASPMTPSRASRGSSVRQGKARSAIENQRLHRLRVGRTAGCDQVAPHAFRRQRQHHRGLALAAMNIGGRDGSAPARSNGCSTQALSPKSPRSSCNRFSRIPRLPPWPLTIARLRAGSERDDLAREIAQIADEALAIDRLSVPARPIVLARQADRQSRQLPQVELVAPALRRCGASRPRRRSRRC